MEPAAYILRHFVGDAKKDETTDKPTREDEITNDRRISIDDY
jgi:hypothetical protein